MKGASIYLTQEEMRVILEGLDLLKTDFDGGNGIVPDDMQKNMDSLESKIYKKIEL